jgi:hypothetical protein
MERLEAAHALYLEKALGGRDELRRRINRIPGVDLPLSRLELRPSFPLQCLADPAGLDAAIEAQAWFLGQLPATVDPAG